MNIGIFWSISQGWRVFSDSWEMESLIYFWAEPYFYTEQIKLINWNKQRPSKSTENQVSAWGDIWIFSNSQKWVMRSDHEYEDLKNEIGGELTETLFLSLFTLEFSLKMFSISSAIECCRVKSLSWIISKLILLFMPFNNLKVLVTYERSDLFL